MYRNNNRGFFLYFDDTTAYDPVSADVCDLCPPSKAFIQHGLRLP